jgi:hypothetical protein
MSETGETRDVIKPTASGPKRVRRHRRRPFLVRYGWVVVPLILCAALAPAAWHWLFNARAARDPLPGYITETAKVEQEYLAFAGKALEPSAEHEFDRATELMLAGNYGNAALVLEAASKQIPVPAVFNDLGVLYRKLKDNDQAIRAFRDALARDHDYAPVRANLKSMDMTTPIDPGSSEVEPNDDMQHANILWLDRPLQGTISAGVSDVDYYWFTTPRPPRDRVAIEAFGRAVSLVPRLRVYNNRGGLITGIKEASGPGEPVRFEFSPPPNTVYYIAVDGVSGSSGPYTVAVNALRAYDVYEPNDSILNSTRIVLGQTIDANIMDAGDTDFYSFVSPVDGSVSIDAASRNASLLIGVATFAPDLHNIDFAPDPKGPGAAVHHTLKVAANQLYSVQVFSKNDSSGPYTLILK